jgi:hypothetical protein
LNSGSTFGVAVYLISQYPLQLISPVTTFLLNSSVSLDGCAVCGGSGVACAGCDGVPNRSLSICEIRLFHFILSRSFTVARSWTTVAYVTAATPA